jgi:hypothetical protein
VRAGGPQAATERLANAAPRAADVVEVSAVAGFAGGDGTLLAPRRVHFSAADTRHVTYGDPDKLDRYLDPEHERALASLLAANEAYRARQRADRERRQAVGCTNTTASDYPATAGPATASTAGLPAPWSPAS